MQRGRKGARGEIEKRKGGSVEKRKKNSTSSSIPNKKRRPLPLPAAAPRLPSSPRRPPGPASPGAPAAAAPGPRRRPRIHARAGDGLGPFFFSSFFLGFFSLLSSLHKRKTPHHLFFFSLPPRNSHHQYQGVGSSMAHRAVDAVLGSRYPAPLEATQAAAQVASAPDEPCGPRAKSFVACMTDEANGGELEACRYYLDSLQACRRQSAGGGSEMQ